MVYYDFVATFAGVGALGLVATVAREVLKVEGLHAFDDFGVEVAFKELSEVLETVIGYGDSQPFERGKVQFYLRDRLVYWDSPVFGEADLEVGRAFLVSVSFSAFLEFGRNLVVRFRFDR